MGFEGTECIGHTKPPLELLTHTNVLPSMMHVQYITTDTVLSSLLSQWVEQIFVCQIKGNATIMAISKHMRYGPVMLPEKHLVLPHNAFFARHTVHIRPTSQENQTLLYANFKMKTIKKFLGRTIQIPTHIRDALQRFTTHVPLPAQTVSEPASSPTTGLQVLCLNTQVSVQSKIRALHAILKQTGFLAALMLHEVGKIPDDFVFHPLYASFCKSPNRNSAGACILMRRTQQIVVLEVHFEPNYRAVVVRATISLKKVQMINVT